MAFDDPKTTFQQAQKRARFNSNGDYNLNLYKKIFEASNCDTGEENGYFRDLPDKFDEDDFVNKFLQ